MPDSYDGVGREYYSENEIEEATRSSIFERKAKRELVLPCKTVLTAVFGLKGR